MNQHARAEFGFQVQHPDPNKFVSIGEITVNNGDILEVGFEQGPVDGSPFYASTGHEVGHLNITSANGRSGNLTLNSGEIDACKSTVLMPISSI